MSMAQEDNILVGSKMLFKFINDSLTIVPVESDIRDYEGSITDCSGTLLGFNHYVYRNDSIKPPSNRFYYDTIRKKCSNFNTFSVISASISSPLEYNKLINLIAHRNNPNNITFSYTSGHFLNDSIIFDTIDCTGFSDTITNAFNSYSSQNIRSDDYFWHIYAPNNNALAFKINKNGLQDYKRSYKLGEQQSKFYGGSVYHTIKTNNTGNQLAIIEDDGTNVLNLYDFNKADGALTYIKPLLTKAQLPNYNFCTGYYESVLDGIAFSKNDSLIYVAYSYSPICTDPYKIVRTIYQIDRFHPNPASTARVVFSKFYATTFPQDHPNKQTSLFTGPDGIVYWGERAGTHIHTITNANVYGGEQHTYNKYTLPGNSNNRGIMTSPSAYVRASFDAFSSCADSTLTVFYGSDDLLRVAYYWGDGDSTVYDSGTMYNGMQTRHRYDSSGIYTITQKSIFNNCGYSKTKSKTINVNIPPSNIGMELTADTACTSHTLTITDTLEHTQSVQIDWGDGELDTLTLATVSASPINIAHTYTTPDTFMLSYKLIGYGIPSEGIAGCERKADSNYVAAFHSTPLAEYTWTTNYLQDEILKDTILLCVNEGLILKQTNDSLSYFTSTNSTGSDTSRRDSILLNPTSGWYKTILRAYTVHGCETSDTFTIGIAPRTTAIWQGDTASCQNQLALQGIKARTTIGSIDSITYNASVLLFESADSLSVPFISSSEGIFTITTMAYSNVGCVDTFNRIITVHSLPSITLAGDSIGCVNTGIAYTPTVVSADSTQLLWYISGTLTNTTAVLPPQEHVAYETSVTTAGTLQIAATATTVHGCSATDTLYTFVQNPPNVQHSESDISTCINEQPIALNAALSLIDTSLVKQTWSANTVDSSQQSSSTTKTSMHTYLLPGEYTVSTVVTTRLSGCADTTYTSITVYPQPEVNLASADACEDMQAEVVTTWNADTLLSFIKTYNNAELLNEVNSPNNSGSSTLYYTAQQNENVLISIVRDTLGCKDTATLTTATLSLPVARYTAQYLSANELEITYLFTDKSINHTSVELFYGDGTSTAETPGFARQYTYADSGTYTSYLVATNQNTCYDTTYTEVLAYPFVDFHIPNSITPNGDGLNDYLNFSTLFVQEMTIDIYTRWGERVLRIASLNELIKTMDLSQGVYLAKYRIKDTFGTYHNVEQTLTVLR